ncbi:MAG TPA: type II CAAX endopeptidase family protein [Candidatus Kapabacteria bacterium]|nr:type II CAAX endopeptidase family protein [Candidatus Kapabacteria bacterium]
MNRKLWVYCGIAYGITWTITLGLYALNRRGAITADELNIYCSLGALGPFLAAIISARLFYGRSGLRWLFGTLSPARLERRSLLLALSPLPLFAIGLLVHRLITGSFFSFEITRREFGLGTAASYLGWCLPFVAYALFEELGWRGFLLPHLQERHSAFGATLRLTLIWGVWHAPLFLFRFNFSIGTSIGFFFGLFVGALILTSIFNGSRGCTLAAIIFHLTNNIASAFDKEYIVATVSTGFILLAAYLLLAYRREALSAGAKIGNYFRWEWTVKRTAS